MRELDSIYDQTLEAMLRRRARRGDPGDLRQQAADAISRTQPSRLAWLLGGGMMRPVLAGGFAPAMAMVLLAALLMGAVVVGASLLRQLWSMPISLEPTIVETVTPVDLTGSRVVADGAGGLWALGDGQVTRVDPASGVSRTWTVSDDRSFVGPVAGPARSGGVWIWSAGSVRRFTGELFAEVITTDWSLKGLDESPDGSLWILGADGGVARRDGAGWVSPASVAPVADPEALVALGPDEAWVAGRGLDGACPGEDVRCVTAAHLERGRWTTRSLTSTEATPLSLVAGPDGSVWVGPAEHGVARLDASRPAMVDGPDGAPVSPIAVGPDGSLWAVAEGGNLLRRTPGGSWDWYSSFVGPRDVASVAASAEGLVAVTPAGLYRVPDEAQGAWTTPLWSAASGPTTGGGVAALVAITASEAWAVDANDRVTWASGRDLGLWHFVDGTWQELPRPPGFAHPVSALAVGPDGALWAANLNRVAVLRPEGWITAHASEDLLVGGGLDVGPDGIAWVGTFNGVLRIEPSGNGFETESIACPVPGVTVAAANDGTVWVGGGDGVYTPGLARLTGSGCGPVDPRSDPTARAYVVQSIATHPRGGVVVAYEEPIDGIGLDAGNVSVSSSVVRLVGDSVEPLDRATTRRGSTQTGVDPSGAVWWVYDGDVGDTPRAGGERGGLVRIEGGRRVDVITGGRALGPVSIAADGTVWFGGPTAIYWIHPDALP